MGSKPLRIRFDEIDGFVKIYDEIVFSNIQSWVVLYNL